MYSKRLSIICTPYCHEYKADQSCHERWHESDGVGDQGTHVAVKTEVIGEVEAQSTADVVELNKREEYNVTLNVSRTQ